MTVHKSSAGRSLVCNLPKTSEKIEGTKVPKSHLGSVPQDPEPATLGLGSYTLKLHPQFRQLKL